ncbi:MAG: response regulator transcription factor [bacterium]|nr:response regulator transcription factor [bacterium]
MSDSFGILQGQRILIVDDSVQITSLLSDVFTRCGSTVEVVNSGQEALDILSGGQFDLVILDLIMPPPDGREVLEFMRNTRPETLIRTILLTGDRYHHRISGIEDDDIQIIYKPFDLSMLRATAACRLVRGTVALGVA